MKSLKKSDCRWIVQFLPVVTMLSILLPLQPLALSLQPLGENNTLMISGRNEFKFADGYKTFHDVPKPWNYLVNSTDFSITAWKLSFKSRFDIEEPSIGFNPPEPVHREYFSRRSLGLLHDGSFCTRRWQLVARRR